MSLKQKPEAEKTRVSKQQPRHHGQRHLKVTSTRGKYMKPGQDTHKKKGLVEDKVRESQARPRQKVDEQERRTQKLSPKNLSRLIK